MLDDPHGYPIELFRRLDLADAIRAALTEFLDRPDHRWTPGTPGTAAEAPHPEPTPRLVRTLGRAAELSPTGATSEHALIAIAEDEQGTCAQLLDELGARTTVERETLALITSESYFPGSCIVVDANDSDLGRPIVVNDRLFVRGRSGHLRLPGE